MKLQKIEERLDRIPKKLVDDLIKLFPNTPITTDMPVNEIFFNAGVQKVINFIQELYQKQENS